MVTCMQGVELPLQPRGSMKKNTIKRFTASRLLRWTVDGGTQNMAYLVPGERGHLQGGAPAQPGHDAGSGGQAVRADEGGAHARAAQEAPEQQRVGAGQKKCKHAAHLHVRQLTNIV